MRIVARVPYRHMISHNLSPAGSLLSLLQTIGPFPEPIIRSVAAQVVNGLDYLHRGRHLIHRDIKPSNILISTRGQVKISDFGVSGQLATGIASCRSWVGTVTYMSVRRHRTPSRPFVRLLNDAFIARAHPRKKLHVSV